MDEWLGPEGKLMNLLDTAGQLILLNLFWLLGCLLVLPAGGATIALYYAVIKSVRRGQGDSLKEFFGCLKRNFFRGLAAFAVLVLAAGLMYVNFRILRESEGQGLLKSATVVVAAVTVFAAMYIFPILSRFTMGVGRAFAMAFTMSIRYLHITLLLVLGTAVLVLAQVYILPVYTVLFIPSAWCYITTFVMEKALRHYMPPKEEADSAWYYE